MFESARSAEPPQSSGITAAIALITLPDATRVETDEPLSNTGSAASRPAGVSPATTRSSRAFLSAFSDAQASNEASQAARSRSKRAVSRVCAITSGATSKVFSGSKPSTVFKPASSSAPSAEPWILPEFCFLGDGQPMMVRKVIRDGLSVTDLAFSIAL